MPKIKKQQKKYIIFVLIPILLVGYTWYQLQILQGYTIIEIWSNMLGAIFPGLLLSGVIYLGLRKYAVI